MNVLYIKEKNTRKPDFLGSAIMETFSLQEDVLTIVNIEIKGVIRTTNTITELIHAYRPDIVIGSKMVASFLLFQIPKNIHKIIVDPYLLFENSLDGTKMNVALRYCNNRLYHWLMRISKELLNNFDRDRKISCYCIVRDMTQLDRYENLISSMRETKNILLAIDADVKDPLELLRRNHSYIRSGRRYFDPEYDYYTEEEILKSEK